MSAYIALIRKDPDSDFGVDFPDFPGCVTAGSTLDEARSMAEEALRFHVDGMLEDGESLPKPRSLATIMTDPANVGAVAFLVDVADRPTRTVRVNVTLPEPALRRIDDWAKSRGLSRSAFLVEAALESIELRRAG